MNKIKILLINPDPNPYVDASRVDFGAPMAILAIGTYLKHKGSDVRIIDARLYKGSQLFLKIDEEIGGVSLVGFSVMTAQIKDSLKISAYIKGKYKDIKIVWAGCILPFFLSRR